VIFLTPEQQAGHCWEMQAHHSVVAACPLGLKLIIMRQM